jgi:hypothetical protein
LTAAEIARVTGVPAGTVRWRLKMGLERLRAALDARHGDRRRWMLLLAPLGSRHPLRCAERPTGTLAMAAGTAVLATVCAVLVGGRGPVAPAARSARSPVHVGVPHLVSGPALPGPVGLAPAPEAAQAIVISGQIRDVVGRAIAAAQVVATGRGRDPQRFEARAGNDGRYRLTVPPADYMVAAEAEGHVGDHRDRRLAADATVDFVLGPAGRVRGVVMDQDRQTPVAGATVHLLGRLDDATTETDDAGAFALDEVSPDIYRVYAYGSGRAGTLAAVAVAGGALVPALVVPVRAAPSIAGHVTDDGKRPIAGAAVQIRSATLAHSISIVSDAAGAYRATGLPAGSYRVVMQAGSYAGRDTEVTLDAADRVVDFALGPEAILTGQVTSSAGDGADGAKVRIELADGGRILTVATGRDGRFEKRGLPPGRARIYARSDGLDSAPRAVSLAAGTTEIALTLPRGASISGVVRRAGGGPAREAVVAALAPGGRTAVVRAAADGRYRLGPLSSGRVAVRAYEPSEAPTALLRDELARLPLPAAADAETRLVVLGDEDVTGGDLALPLAGLALAGVAVTSDGEPLAGAQVVAHPLGSTAWQTRIAGQLDPYRTFTDPAGRFRLDDLPAGAASLLVEYPGLPPLELPAVTAGDTSLRVHLAAGRPGGR